MVEKRKKKKKRCLHLRNLVYGSGLLCCWVSNRFSNRERETSSITSGLEMNLIFVFVALTSFFGARLLPLGFVGKKVNTLYARSRDAGSRKEMCKEKKKKSLGYHKEVVQTGKGMEGKMFWFWGVLIGSGWGSS